MCRFRGRQLHSTGGRILKMQSSYNITVTAEILTETLFIRSFQSLYWNVTRGVLRLYTSLEVLLDS